MGHCSRARQDRPEFRQYGWGNPDWTVVDPYRFDRYAWQSPTRQDEPYRPSRATGHTGRSHFVPITPVIVLLIVFISWFPAGLVLLPMVVVGLAMATMAGQGGRGGRWEQRPGPVPPTWSPLPVRQQAPVVATPPAGRPDGIPSRSTTDDEWPSRDPAVRSPFDRPAFWEEEPAPDHRLRPAPLSGPAWDPLGVEPLSWDFPDNAPPTPPRRRGSHLGALRLIPPIVLLAALVVAAGDSAGWWPLDWAAAAAGAGAVVAVALAVMSSRHRSRR